MGKVQPTDLGIGLQWKKSIGKGLLYGIKRHGNYKYGEQEPVWGPKQYGYNKYGTEKYANAQSPWGIFRIRRERKDFLTAGEKEDGPQYIQRETFHIPANPQTEIQQSNRTKFAEAITSWQSLTNEQKEAYNKKAERKQLSGYNLYISEYMLSN